MLVKKATYSFCYTNALTFQIAELNEFSTLQFCRDQTYICVCVPCEQRRCIFHCLEDKCSYVTPVSPSGTGFFWNAFLHPHHLAVSADMFCTFLAHFALYNVTQNSFRCWFFSMDCRCVCNSNLFNCYKRNPYLGPFFRCAPTNVTFPLVLLGSTLLSCRLKTVLSYETRLVIFVRSLHRIHKMNA
jgi:hypothetical protein